MSLAGCCIGDNQPGGMFYVRGGLGTTTGEVKANTGNPPSAGGDTDGDNYNAEIAIEGQGRVVGGGVRVSGFLTDDEYGGTGADTTVLSYAVFPHLTFRPCAGMFRVPIRIGPEFRATSIDAPLIGAFNPDVDFYTIGGAVEIAPEIDFVRTDRFALSLYGRGHAGIGVGAINNADDNTPDFATTATLWGAEGGLRVQLSKFMLSGGYVWQSTIYDESSGETLGASTGLKSPETTITNDGFFVSLGIRF